MSATISHKDIKADIEYVRNQLDYLTQYQVKIVSKCKSLDRFVVKWKGLSKDELVYKEIERWVKCYNQLGSHLKTKVIPENEVQALQNQVFYFEFIKPSSVEEDGLTGVLRVCYQVIPAYRLLYNKKKTKKIKKQVAHFSELIASLNTLAYKIQAFYTDGL